MRNITRTLVLLMMIAALIGKMTNQKLGELWNSFGIPQGNFDLNVWIGKSGAARVKHEEYNGEVSPKIAFFIGKERQDKLMPWKEPSKSASTSGFIDITPADDLPWS